MIVFYNHINDGLMIMTISNGNRRVPNMVHHQSMKISSKNFYCSRVGKELGLWQCGGTIEKCRIDGERG